MKKYIRAMVCIPFTLIKFNFIKVFHFKGFKFPLLSLISPITEIELGRKSELVLKKMVRIKSGSKIRVRKGASIRIGENTSLNHGCMLTSHERILIGDNVQLGPNVLIYDHDHNFRKKDGLKNLEYNSTAVEIGNNVWIGANVVVLRGTKIGDNCVVGAGVTLQGEYEKNTIILGKREIFTKKFSLDS